MKGMKVMKAMKKSKIARGPRAKWVVLKGGKEKTSGGLKGTDLMKNKRGKVVSKKAASSGKRAYAHIKVWVECVVQARKELGMTGFVPINGKSPQGKALYAKAKALYAEKKP